MRIVYVDMHEIVLLCKTYHQLKIGNKIHAFKHRFIVDYAQKTGMQVCNYVSGKQPLGKKGKMARMLIPNFELFKAKKVIQENGFAKDILILKDISEIKDDDIVILYFYDLVQRNMGTELPATKIMFGNHFIRINEPFDFTGKNIKAFVNEVDLNENEFISEFFYMADTKHLVCPFAFEQRFKINKNFESRLNKMLAIGTLSTVKYVPGYELYSKWAGMEWVQPMRKTLFDNRDNYSDEIDSCISYILEDQKVITESDNFIKKVLKKIYNKKVRGRQIKYTSFDMVDKFNEYKMFACPEEKVGMPGIGFVEGMACGCAYIGLDHNMYKDLGLIPGKHYISYNGTLEDMLSKIRYYQVHTDECAAIAKEGAAFVRSHFNQEKVASDFIKEMENISIR